MMVLQSHLFIPASRFDNALRRRLTIDNPEYAKQVSIGVVPTAPERIKLYKEVEWKGEVYFRVPRYTLGTPEELFCSTNAIEFDVSEVPCDIHWKPKDRAFALNESQMATIKEIGGILDNHWGGIIIAKTGEGKTTMAIQEICNRRQKTLVLVHKTALIEQWRASLLALTDLCPEDIGLLQSGKFVDGKVVIGSQASLMRGTIPASVNRAFGFVIQDEVHRIGALMFLRSFTRFNSKYRLGLSATPNREDGLESIYFMHISSKCVVHKAVRNVQAEYTSIFYERMGKWNIFNPYLPMKTALVNNIVVDAKRNLVLLGEIAHALDGGRKILVLSERIAHLKVLMAETVKYRPEKKVVRFFGAEALTKKQRKEGWVQEKWKDPRLTFLQDADAIFATYSKAKEGLDVPPLDTILFATPFSSSTTLVQAKGRIERAHEGKHHPLVIDIEDTGQFLLEAMSKKRRRLYAELEMRRASLPK
jgi:superfamily II DNA or RNA helicase